MTIYFKKQICIINISSVKYLFLKKYFLLGLLKVGPKKICQPCFKKPRLLKEQKYQKKQFVQKVVNCQKHILPSTSSERDFFNTSQCVLTYLCMRHHLFALILYICTRIFLLIFKPSNLCMSVWVFTQSDDISFDRFHGWKVVECINLSSMPTDRPARLRLSGDDWEILQLRNWEENWKREFRKNVSQSTFLHEIVVCCRKTSNHSGRKHFIRICMALTWEFFFEIFF